MAAPIEEKFDDIDAKQDDDGYYSSSISNTEATLTDHGYFGKENETERLLKECMDLRKAKAKFVINNDKSVTFYPSESVGIKASKASLPTQQFTKSNRFQKIMHFLQCERVEHIYDDTAQIVSTQTFVNPFAAAAEFAFYKHYPLSIKPSDIWILILQGTALHLSQNAEKLRKRFVNHEGKKTLTVVRPDFVKGSKNNDWDGVVHEFAEQIDKNTVKDIVSLFEPDFSTATMMDRLAARVCTMDILKEYFVYQMLCGCGFPQITLNGTKDDWVKLKQKAKTLLSTKLVPEFGQKWGKALFPVIQRFIDAYDGKIDCLFWNSMVRRGATGASGGRYLPAPGSTKGAYCGWLNVFFPYNEQRKEGSNSYAQEKQGNKNNASATISWNGYCVPYSKKASYVLQGISNANTGGMDSENFPLGIGSAPVIYKDVKDGSVYNLKFVSGFLGMEQDPKTLELSCKVGWFVTEK